jgi:hypothetical protein
MKLVRKMICPLSATIDYCVVLITTCLDMSINNDMLEICSTSPVSSQLTINCIVLALSKSKHKCIFHKMFSDLGPAAKCLLSLALVGQPVTTSIISIQILFSPSRHSPVSRIYCMVICTNQTDITSSKTPGSVSLT